MDEEWIEHILGEALGKKRPNWENASLGTPYLII